MRCTSSIFTAVCLCAAALAGTAPVARAQDSIDLVPVHDPAEDEREKHVDPASPDDDPGAVAPSQPTQTAPSAPPAIVIDDAAAQQYRACLLRLGHDLDADARKCLRDVIAAAPGTAAALQAEAALFVLETHLDRPTSTADDADGAREATSRSVDIAPGRLGVGLAGGLLGVFTALNGGFLVGANMTVETQPIVLGTGAAAVVLGAAGGVGGYLLAEQLKLDEADARLIGSSLAWGAVIGGHLGVILGDTLDPQGSNPRVAVNTLDLALVTTTWAAGAGATVGATYLNLTEAQVGLINSGGMIGATWSPASVANVAEVMGQGADPRGVAIASLAPITLGLVGGGVLGAFVPMTWGEVLICDLGGVLGLVGGGAAMLASTNSGSPVLLFLPAAGALAGWSATAVGVVSWRSMRAAGAAAASRGPSPGTPFRLMAPLMLDRNGAIVPSIGVQGVL